jgi:hypothetical protein
VLLPHPITHHPANVARPPPHGHQTTNPRSPHKKRQSRVPRQ